MECFSLVERFEQDSEENSVQSSENLSKKARKQRTQSQKLGLNRHNNQLIRRALCDLDEIKTQLRWLHARALKEGWGKIEESDFQKVFEDQVDQLIFERIKAVGDNGIFPKDVAAWINQQGKYGLKHYHVSRRILRMNKKLRYETGEFLFEKRGHKWALTAAGFEVYQ